MLRMRCMSEVREHFSEVETVNLTLVITTINAWNRIAIALGDFPGHAGAVAEVEWTSESRRGQCPHCFGRNEAVEDWSRLPMVTASDAVMLRAVGLTKIYPAVAGTDVRVGMGRGARWSCFAGWILGGVRERWSRLWGRAGRGRVRCCICWRRWIRPTAGEVWVGETRLSGLTARQAAEFRNRDVGYVWQFHYLLPEFTALENVAMPLLARGMRRAAALEKARVWLGEVGLADAGGAPVGRVERRASSSG